MTKTGFLSLFKTIKNNEWGDFFVTREFHNPLIPGENLSVEELLTLRPCGLKKVLKSLGCKLVVQVEQVVD